MQDLLLQTRVTMQNETENGDGQQQEGKERQEPVVGEQGRQVVALVICVLVEDRQRQTNPPVAPLKSIKCSPKAVIDTCVHTQRNRFGTRTAGAGTRSTHAVVSG